VPLPNQITERTAIGNFFRNLDEQIAAQTQRLEQLKHLKAAYLQRTFVGQQNRPAVLSRCPVKAQARHLPRLSVS